MTDEKNRAGFFLRKYSELSVTLFFLRMSSHENVEDHVEACSRYFF